MPKVAEMLKTILYIIVFYKVTVMVFLSGRQNCLQQKILFVNRETSECSMEVRCQSGKGISYSSNGTLCLVRVNLKKNQVNWINYQSLKENP